MSVKGARGVLCNGDGGSGTTVITVNHEELLLNNCYTHSSRPISQIPQCIKYPTMHHFITEMCTRVHISVTCAYFCFKMVYCGIWDWCIVGFVTGLFINCFLIHNLPRYAYIKIRKKKIKMFMLCMGCSLISDIFFTWMILSNGIWFSLGNALFVPLLDVNYCFICIQNLTPFDITIK